MCSSVLLLESPSASFAPAFNNGRIGFLLLNTEQRWSAFWPENILKLNLYSCYALISAEKYHIGHLRISEQEILLIFLIQVGKL